MAASMTDKEMIAWLRDYSHGDPRHPAYYIAIRLQQLTEMRRHPVELTAEVQQLVAEGTRIDHGGRRRYVEGARQTMTTLDPYVAEYNVRMVGAYRDPQQAAQGLAHELEKHVRSIIE